VKGETTKSIHRKTAWKKNPFPQKKGAVAAIREGNQVEKRPCLLL